MKIKNLNTWISVILLIAIEQIIKIIIYTFFFDNIITLVPKFIYFSPMFNRDYSWYNSMLQLGVSKATHIVLVLIISILMALFYQYLTYRYSNNKLVNASFAFLFSGAMCSLIDKVFWNGSLDYIHINMLFTFDLKDVYINISIGLMIIFIFIKRKAISKLDEKVMLKEFFQYTTRSFRKAKQK